MSEVKNKSDILAVKTTELPLLPNGKMEMKVGQPVELTLEQAFGGISISGDSIELLYDTRDVRPNEILQVRGERPLLTPIGNDNGALSVKLTQDEFHLTRSGISSHRVFGGQDWPGAPNPREVNGKKFDVPGTRLAITLNETSWVEINQHKDGRITLEAKLTEGSEPIDHLEDVPGEVFDTFGLQEIGNNDDRIYGAEINGKPSIVHYEQTGSAINILTITNDGSATLRTRDRFTEKTSDTVVVTKDNATEVLVNGQEPASGHKPKVLDTVNHKINAAMQKLIDSGKLNGIGQKSAADININDLFPRKQSVNLADLPVNN